LGLGLGSPGIGDTSPTLGFDSRRRLGRVPARGWLEGERAVARVVVGEETEVDGLFMQLSVKQMNSAQGLFVGFSKGKRPLCKVASAGARTFLLSRAGLGQIWPNTIHSFPFLFCCQTWKFVENTRKK
jgi:hypothetical protein